MPASAPPAAPAPEPPSLEALLLRFRLITSAQLDEAQRTKAETGRDLGEIVVERGWMTDDQLERIRSYAPALANARPEPMDPGAPPLRAAPPLRPAPEAGEPSLAPTPVAPVVPPPAPPAPIADLSSAPAVEPILAPPVAAEPLPQAVAPQAAADVAARVLVHLTNGERVEAGRFQDVAAARARAAEIVAALNGTDGSWPFYGGRFLRPDAIVSVDLELVHA